MLQSFILRSDARPCTPPCRLRFFCQGSSGNLVMRIPSKGFRSVRGRNTVTLLSWTREQKRLPSRHRENKSLRPLQRLYREIKIKSKVMGRLCFLPESLMDRLTRPRLSDYLCRSVSSTVLFGPFSSMAGRLCAFVRNSRGSLMFLIHSTINQPPFSLFSSNRITSSRDKGPTNHLEKQSVA